MLAEKCKTKCNTNQGDIQKTTARPGIRKYLPSAMNMVLMWWRWKGEAWTMVFPSPNEEVILLGQRPYTGHSHVVGVPCIVAEKRHMTEDQELNILEEMPGRVTKISAPAQGDQWFTLWPTTTSHQSSHRKIMSLSNEFMQVEVHLSEIKKSHFHFKTRTLELLSRQEQTESQYQYVSSFCSCLLSDFSGSLHHQTYTGHKGTWLYPIKSHTKSIFLQRCFHNTTSELKTNTPKWTTATIMWTQMLHEKKHLWGY